MHKFDKIFKHKLSHAHTEVAAHNWEKIVSRLDQADALKPRVWPYRLALTGMAIVLLMVGTTWVSNSLQYSDLTSPTAKNQINTNSNKGDTYSLTSSQVAIPYADNTEIIASGSTDGINNSSLSNDLNATISTNHAVDSDVRSIKNFAASINKDTPITPVDEGAFQTVVLESSIKNANIQIAPLVSPNFDAVISNDEHLISDVIASSNAPQTIKLPALGYQPSTLLAIRRKIKSKPTSKTTPACPFTLNGHMKSLEVYVSHDYISKSLSAPDEFVNVIAERESSESAMYSFSAGFRFGYMIAPRVNVHLGANYSHMNEKFSYVDPESVQERTITIKDYIYENGKIIDSLVTTETIKLPGTSTIKKQNSFTSFDIPILGRFTILGNRNISLSALAGPIINVSYGHKGMIIGTDLKPVDISDNQIYKPQLGVRLYSGISLAYHLAGDLDFVFEPHARISFDDVSKDNYPIAQRHQSFGVHTGLRYRF